MLVTALKSIFYWLQVNLDFCLFSHRSRCPGLCWPYWQRLPVSKLVSLWGIKHHPKAGWVKNSENPSGVVVSSSLWCAYVCHMKCDKLCISSLSLLCTCLGMPPNKVLIIEGAPVDALTTYSCKQFSSVPQCLGKTLPTLATVKATHKRRKSCQV